MSEETDHLPLDEWERHAEYICRQPALTNAKNQAMRVLQLIAEIRRMSPSGREPEEDL